jgi:hypothetical protein
MHFNIAPDDLYRVAGTLLRQEPHPLALAGRLIGMSGEEARAGAPAWAWTVAAFVVGAGAGVAIYRAWTES